MSRISRPGDTHDHTFAATSAGGSPASQYRSGPVIIAVIALTTVPVAANTGSQVVFFVAVGFGLIALAAIKRRLALSPVQVVTLALPVTFYSVGPVRVNLSLADLVLLTAIAGTALQAKNRPRTGGIFYGGAAVAAYALVVQIAAWASLLAASVQGTLLNLPEGLFAAAKLALAIAYCMHYLGAATAEFRHGDLRILRVWTDAALGSAMVGICAIGLRLVGFELGLTLSFRATGTFEDPNAYAAYLLASAGVIVYAHAFLYGKVWTWKLVPVLVAVFLTGSRAALVALALSAFVCIVTFGRRARALRRTTTALGIIGVAFIALVPAQSTRAAIDRALSVTDPTSRDTDIRFDLWRIAFELWSDHPLFGIGLGQFRAVSLSQYGSDYGQLAHNTYLSFLAETGLVGVATFLLLPVTVALVAVRSTLVDPSGKWVFLTFGLGTIYVEAIALNLENFRPLWAIFGVILALATLPTNLVANRTAQSDGPISEPPVLRQRNRRKGTDT